MEQKTTTKRGGARLGAGRKKIDNEPKCTITFSVPEGVAEEVKAIVRATVARYRERVKLGEADKRFFCLFFSCVATICFCIR